MARMARMVSDPDTLAYVERRTKEGKSKHEIIRCLNALCRSGIPPAPTRVTSALTSLRASIADSLPRWTSWAGRSARHDAIDDEGGTRNHKKPPECSTCGTPSDSLRHAPADGTSRPAPRAKAPATAQSM